MQINLEVIKGTRQHPFPDLRIDTGEVVFANKNRMTIEVSGVRNRHASQEPGKVLITELKRVSSGTFACGVQTCAKPMMCQLMQICPSPSSQVAQRVKSTPTNIHIPCDKDRTLKCISNLQHPCQNLTIEKVLVTTNHRIGEKVHRENMKRQLRNLNNGVQQSLGTPGLLRNEPGTRGKDMEGTCKANTSAQATKGTKRIGNSKFVWDRVRTRQVKAKTSEFRVKGGERPPSVGSLAECDNLALPLTHQITLAQKLSRVCCREVYLDLWNGFGDSPRFGGVTQDLLQFIVSRHIFRSQLKNGLRVRFFQLSET